jgi:hypothetical protein
MAITQAHALRRKIVDCRFPRAVETELLDKATELMDSIEAAAKPAEEQKGGDAVVN